MPDVLSESDQVRAQELGQIMGNSLGGAFLRPPSTSVRVCQHITVQLYQMPHLAQGTYLNPCQTEVKLVVLPSNFLFSTLFLLTGCNRTVLSHVLPFMSP